MKAAESGADGGAMRDIGRGDRNAVDARHDPGGLAVEETEQRACAVRHGSGAFDAGAREILVPLNLAQHWQRHDAVTVDTTDILFLCAGTFTDVFAYAAEGRAAILVDVPEMLR